jgi:hypothetical protein
LNRRLRELSKKKKTKSKFPASTSKTKAKQITKRSDSKPKKPKRKKSDNYSYKPIRKNSKRGPSSAKGGSEINCINGLDLTKLRNFLDTSLSKKSKRSGKSLVNVKRQKFRSRKQRRPAQNSLYPSQLEYDLFRDKPENDQELIMRTYDERRGHDRYDSSVGVIGRKSNSSLKKMSARNQAFRKSLGGFHKTKLRGGDQFLRKFSHKRSVSRNSNRTFGKKVKVKNAYLRASEGLSASRRKLRLRKSNFQRDRLNSTHRSKKSTMTLQSRIEFEEKFALDYSRAFSARKMRSRNLSHVTKIQFPFTNHSEKS